MPRQTKDRDTTWELEGDNRTWTLTANATIETEGASAIYDDGSGSRIKVLGSAHSENSYGVQMGAGAPGLFVGRRGSVTSGDDHAVLVSVGGTIENHGTIAAAETGIVKGGSASFAVSNTGLIEGASMAISLSSEDFSLDNTGVVRGGETGIYVVATKSEIGNLRGAEIVGDAAAIHYSLAGEHFLVNKGLIFGEENSIVSNSGTTVNIRNTGTISGDIVLGNGDDRIDTRGGIVRGEIRGGEGDDTYVISSTNTRIAETGASLGDVVRSTASYTLRGGLDDLRLLGNGDIDGVGNDGDNEIRGNAGDNELDGNGGVDFLSGGGGNDQIAGGAGADFFEFRRGFDVDRVFFYIDGVDKLVSQDVMTQSQFDRLDIRQAGEDVVIDFGKGDRLILVNVSKTDIDFSDFAML